MYDGDSPKTPWMEKTAGAESGFLPDVDLASQHSLLGQYIQIQSLTSMIESCVCIGYDPMVAFVPSEHNPGLPGTLWWDIVDAC